MTKRRETPWNRCDICGRFYSFEDQDTGRVRVRFEPDSAFGPESYERFHVECEKRIEARHD